MSELALKKQFEQDLSGAPPPSPPAEENSDNESRKGEEKEKDENIRRELES